MSVVVEGLLGNKSVRRGVRRNIYPDLNFCLLRLVSKFQETSGGYRGT